MAQCSRQSRTVIGAVMSVVPVACFPQDRVLFLGGLALWGAVCAFVATILRNFASYASALAGYTAAIVAGDLLGQTGGVDANSAFLLAVTRASEIIIGIACAGVVVAGDRSRRRPPPVGDAVCGPDGRDHGRLYPHIGDSCAATP